MKLAELTARTGLTVGSFYHHFSGMPEYLDALAGYYGAAQVDEHLDELLARPPRDRLRSLLQIATDDRMRPLDVAMRDWSGSNEAAAAAVRAADAALLDFIATAFEELGHDRSDARLRAMTLLSVGVARIHTPWRTTAADAERIIELCCSKP